MRTDHSYTIGGLMFWVLIATVVVILEIAACSVVRAEDRGFFNCFHLTPDQQAWFASSGISNCCSLADGMPTRFEDRPDGTYVPSFDDAYFEAQSCRDNPDRPFDYPHPNEDRSKWIKVGDDKILKKSNPIGVGVVWWVNAGNLSQTTPHDVRCFVGLLKV